MEPPVRTWKMIKKYNKMYVLQFHGIDRIDSNLGYCVENCTTCCASCNFAKSDLSLDNFRKWIEQLVKFNMSGIKW